MHRITEFFLKHSMLVNVLVVAVIGLGIKSLLEIKKEGFPEISLNRVIIQTVYPGAAASDVERNVTLRIEEALEEVEGIKEVLSVSDESISRIEVHADDSASAVEFKKLYDDVDSALSSIDDLPSDIENKPSISEFTSSDIPIMEIALTGEFSVLKPFADRLGNQIRKLPGVGGVTVVGLPDEEFQVLVDPARAAASRVDLRMIYNALSRRNVEGSGGTLNSPKGEKKVVFQDKYAKATDAAETLILSNTDGFGVRLSDVAEIRKAPEDMGLIVRSNGKRGAALSVRKTGSSDLLKTVDSINKLLSATELPDGAGMKVILDQSRLTRDRLSLLAGNAVIGFLLVAAVLFLIFNFKTALWTAFGIPFSLLGMFIFLKITGMSLNLISLGGFIIIIGMLVDDAIVVSEEFNSNRESGLSPHESAVMAVKRMWLPVAASCLTTIVAFSPIFAVGGFPGKFIWAIPLMVIVGLSISLIESYVILPVHLTHGRHRASSSKHSYVVKLEAVYKRALSRAIRLRFPVLGAALLLLFASFIVLGKVVKKDPFPQDAAEGFSVTLTLPPGSSAARTERATAEIESLILGLGENELVGLSTRIGTHSLLSATERGTQNNLAAIFVYLTPYSKRDRTADELITHVTAGMKALEPLRKSDFKVELTRLGPPMGKPFEIRVISNDDALRRKRVEEITSFLSQVPGVYDIEDDELEGKNELALNIDHATLARTGLTSQDVITALRLAFDGMKATDITTLEGTTEFRVMLNDKARANTRFLETLPIANSRGNLINLSMFTALSEKPSFAGIRHIDGDRATTVSGSAVLKTISPVEVMNIVRGKFPSDDKARIDYSGQPVETEKIMAGLSSAAIAALLGIFLLMALILNSFKRPLVIMSAIPFLAVGFAFVLVTHGIPASMMTGVAMVGLMGVIVNNSIVMVHTIRGEAGSIITENAIINGAVQRLRPVLLTTITTVLGVLPTGYGIGGSDPFLSHMSLAMAYGLLFGTLITLFAVPILLRIGLDIGKIRQA